VQLLENMKSPVYELIKIVASSRTRSLSINATYQWPEAYFLKTFLLEN